MKAHRTGYLCMLALITALFFASCEPFFNCLDGNGVAASEVRIVPEFSSVKNSTSFDVEIMHDSTFHVEVFADENLLPYINIYVVGEQLIVETEYSRCLVSSNPILVEVYMPSLNEVNLTGSGNLLVSKFKVDDMKFKCSGSGDIIAWNFECTELDVRNSGSGEINISDVFSSGDVSATLTGSGDIVLTGNADNAIYLLTGSGSLRVDDFPVNVCSVSSSGSGNIYCNVNQTLNVVMTGSGNITYYGTPKVSKLITGSGRLYSAY